MSLATSRGWGNLSFGPFTCTPAHALAVSYPAVKGRVCETFEQVAGNPVQDQV